jgi:hypothetical protein
MSRNYQQPTIIKDDQLSWEQIFYNDEGKFVLEKQILFHNNSYNILKMDINEPFNRDISVHVNLTQFYNVLSEIEQNKYLRCIDVSTQLPFEKQKTWNDLLKLHKMDAKKRNNQVSYCLAHLEKLKDSIQQPEFVKKNDWIDWYYPITERNSDNGIYDSYPRTQKVILTSTRHSWMDMHLDYGGAGLWYHLFKGQKEFLIIEPTDEIIKLHIDHITLKKENDDDNVPNWFADKVSEMYPNTIS